MEGTPNLYVAGHVIDFIGLDGSVVLSLETNEADRTGDRLP